MLKTDPSRQPDTPFIRRNASPRKQKDELTTPVIDLVAPIGKGQRALITRLPAPVRRHHAEDRHAITATTRSVLARSADR